MQNSLNMAYIAEKSAFDLYENLKSHGEVFSQINEIRKSGFVLLNEFAKANKIELKHELDLPFYSCDSFEDALIYAINYEISLCKTYENITQNLKDEHLKDICFRLWATSNNEYITTLKSCLKDVLNANDNTKYIQESQNNYENLLSSYQKDFIQMSKNLQDVVSGKADKKKINEILNNPNFSFLSGMAVGVFGASILSKNLNNNEEN